MNNVHFWVNRNLLETPRHLRQQQAAGPAELVGTYRWFPDKTRRLLESKVSQASAGLGCIFLL